ncbi:MAG: hypothetical protein A2561_03800 [Candidatus Staskawiczbacteria bacterium RIFOXYD1_FULL_32_13]|uniref:Nucleotidyl transferase AbiEii/AbiGii toxin family protein n=1 Tax=Candidatus Staskawiczbacteria bacterium RIFOXYD1_FULL_32_13 TaxID=1802234 RepID=A0A1G2JMU5_9BACT|nr:MAG: hypothetical protein A2256_03100 [Candidatus Staskawiczbacteria bacterium RIFOXYA2_FULL_32_7]OGZ85045.1 MAG: hypothetical protein A2463_04660 [Candidatus Staskawiczbacteria bacterium RIFOXYC2_FULL_32_10]OGZ88476.1 MAG: hypothetical protein A2561_03800 [Candidatus Staskawiczbacteria bacterium RIFOXYD1_FULL_32_13]
MEIPLFEKNGWYLAGGTALALQSGHRVSVDLDFFTLEKQFDEKKVAEELSTFGNWETTFIKEGTVYGKIDGAKISLISYPFFKPSESFLKIGTISILSPKDIGAMKIIAISQRGKKRDFFDLYWISKNIQPLSKSIEIMQKHYIVKQNDGHILKSLTYFNDAEDDKDPIINFKASWKEVKNFFKKEALNMARIGNK